MILSKLLVPLLLLLASLASPVTPCKSCGVGKTSTKRLKMPGKSVFTRLANIQLTEVYQILPMHNHELCAQQCDKHRNCAALEFLIKERLCVLSTEYERTGEDMTTDAFKAIVFVKVRGKFTKSMPKQKETCIDQSEYEDYVVHEVPKWLAPSPKKNSAKRTSTLPPTSVSDPDTPLSTSSTAARSSDVSSSSSSHAEWGPFATSTAAGIATTLAQPDQAKTQPTWTPTIVGSLPPTSATSVKEDPVGSGGAENASTHSSTVMGQGGSTSEALESSPSSTKFSTPEEDPTTSTLSSTESTTIKVFTTSQPSQTVAPELKGDIVTIKSVKQEKFVNVDGDGSGVVLVEAGKEHKWEILSKGEKVVVKAENHMFLGFDRETGKVQLGEEEFEWAKKSDNDGSFSFSVESFYLSARESGDVITIRTAHTTRTERFVLVAQ